MSEHASASDAAGGHEGQTPSPAEALAEHERHRVRSSLRIVVFGLVAAVVAAVGSGVTVGDGRASFAVLLLVVAASTAIAGLHHGLLLVVDDLRGRPTSLRRGGWVAGYFALTAVLMAAIAGIGG